MVVLMIDSHTFVCLSPLDPAKASGWYGAETVRAASRASGRRTAPDRRPCRCADTPAPEGARNHPTETRGRDRRHLQQVQKYERGTNRVTSGRLRQLAKALDLSVDALVGDEPTRAGGFAELPAD